MINSILLSLLPIAVDVVDVVVLVPLKWEHLDTHLDRLYEPS